VTHPHAARKPFLKLFPRCSCRSRVTTSCLLLLLEQYTMTQRARHLLPLSLSISPFPSLYPCRFLSLPQCFFLSFFPPILFLIPPSPGSLLPAVQFLGGGDFARFKGRACVCCVCFWNDVAAHLFLDGGSGGGRERWRCSEERRVGRPWLVVGVRSQSRWQTLLAPLPLYSFSPPPRRLSGL